MRDRIAHWIARKLLPRRVVYWSAVVVGAHATTGKYSKQVVPLLGFTDAIARYSRDHGLADA